MANSDRFGYTGSWVEGGAQPKVGDLVYASRLPNGGGKVVSVKRLPKNQYGEEDYSFKVAWTDGTSGTYTTVGSPVALFDKMIRAKEAELSRLTRARDKAARL